MIYFVKSVDDNDFLRWLSKCMDDISEMADVGYCWYLY